MPFKPLSAEILSEAALESLKEGLLRKDFCITLLKDLFEDPRILKGFLFKDLFEDLLRDHLKGLFLDLF